jgi:hypothetical protein
MSETMNTNMEKHYFTYILDNPEQFSKLNHIFLKIQILILFIQ